jgi:hypothetical protein
MIRFVFSLFLVLVGIGIALVVTFLSRKGPPRVSKINEVSGRGGSEGCCNGAIAPPFTAKLGRRRSGTVAATSATAQIRPRLR